VGNGRREELRRVASKARARLRGPPEHQLPLSSAHGGLLTRSGTVAGARGGRRGAGPGRLARAG
jgi:hypothetical protein